MIRKIEAAIVTFVCVIVAILGTFLITATYYHQGPLAAEEVSSCELPADDVDYAYLLDEPRTPADMHKWAADRHESVAEILGQTDAGPLEPRHLYSDRAIENMYDTARLEGREACRDTHREDVIKAWHRAAEACTIETKVPVVLYTKIGIRIHTYNWFKRIAEKAK